MKWSPEFVAFVREADPDDVLRGMSSVAHASRAKNPAGRREWYLVNLAQRLSWARGDERAAAILSGEDPATQADLASWHRLERAA